MKHHFTIALSIAISFTTLSALARSKKQTNKTVKPSVAKAAVVPVTKTCLLQGKILNSGKRPWSFSHTGLFGFKVVDVPVDAEGTFSKAINIDHISDLYLYLKNYDVKIFVQPGDTLTINWDNRDVKNTLSIKTGNDQRQSEVDLQMDQQRSFGQTINKLNDDLWSKSIPDTIKYQRIRDLFLAQMKQLTDRPATHNAIKMIYDIYFENAAMLADLGRRTGLSYKLPMSTSVSDDKKAMFGGAQLYSQGRYNIETLLDERVFYMSAVYRQFIEEKVKADGPFNSLKPLDGTKGGTSNFTLQRCYTVMSKLGMSPMIRDWSLARAVMNGFEFHTFSDVVEAYNKVLPEMKEPAFKKALMDSYADMQSLKPGNPAPIFKLKDTDGKTVSLSDFKGKVVFIDFWGVYCGPCIADIKDHGEQFHKKYKEQGVVFINICSDAGEKEWKKSVADLKLEGVNLIADKLKDPACRAYKIDGIPHYVIVDAAGKIVNNSAPGMGALMGNGINIPLDKNGRNELDIAISKNR